MKNKVCIVNAYFGSFPNYFQLFLNSCGINEEFNYLIVTDCKDKYNYPENVKVIYKTFEEVKEVINKKLDFKCEINDCYKLCDFKTLYGIIFSEYLKEYTHWGHCDLDMIFGKLNHFITDEVLNEYDKVLRHGHLTIYKNNEQVNNSYRLPFSCGDYKVLIGSRYHYGFDESQGINKIYDENNINQWKKDIFVDMNFLSERLKASNNENFDGQKFICDKGAIKQIYKLDGKEYEREYAYIHLQKRKMKINVDIKELGESYIIAHDGFYPLDTDEKKLQVTFGEQLKRRVKFEIVVLKIKAKWNLQWKILTRMKNNE